MGRSTGAVEAIAASRSYALSVLTSDDIPFVQDGLRDGEHLRGVDDAALPRAVARAWIEVRGSVEERVEQVLSACARMFSRT